MKTKKVVINTCYGGFGLSDQAYEKLIKWGIPVRKYIKEPINPKTGRYDIPVPNNEERIIFDRKLDDKEEQSCISFMGRYWETWLDNNREHPLLVKVVEKLGEKANGDCAELKIVEIPDGTDYTIEEYDGLESIHETHLSWS